MKPRFYLTSFFILIFLIFKAQTYVALPKIEKDKLNRDLDILYQALDQFHTGMYWYTPKDSVDMAFREARIKLNRDMNVIQFYNVIGPLVALSREGHTGVSFSKEDFNFINNNALYFPFLVKFLDRKMYLYKNGSNDSLNTFEGKIVKSINNLPTEDLMKKISQYVIADGYISGSKYNDVGRFGFSRYYYYLNGETPQFQLEFENGEKIVVEGLKIEDINKNLNRESKKIKTKEVPKHEWLEFKILSPKIAYLGIHSFQNDHLKETKYKTLENYLELSFDEISEMNISTLIIDVSKNGGGTEGNEGLLYSYFGPNYQKYNQVVAKAQKVKIDNGIDKPITLKTYGLLERLFTTKKLGDGSIARKNSIGNGLMAYKKPPNDKFYGKVYVVIGPNTYSGASEFANMMKTQNLATFVGEETGGSYRGNTSGYSRELILPNSKIEIDIPALQFDMNVKPTTVKGRGVLPDLEIRPTYEEFINNENPAVEYILNLESTE